ncbi:hypothetical protein V6N13_139168 [Hibiscus sabdariffa]
MKKIPMSKLRYDRESPLVKSPIRQRPRRVLGSNSTSMQTPSGSLMKSQKPLRAWSSGESEIRPEYLSISSEGRFYEEYSARRNERLKRRRGETGTESKSGHHLGVGVTIGSTKRRESKKLESLRKSGSAAYSAKRNEIQTPRYSLRSMSKAQDNKKPPVAVIGTAGRRV